MNLFKLIIVGVLAVAISGSIFAAEPKKASEKKETSLISPHLEWMPDEIKLDIIKKLIDIHKEEQDIQSDFSKAVEILKNLMRTSRKLHEFIYDFAIPDLSSYMAEKFFNNEKYKASAELMALSFYGALSPFALALLLEAGADPNTTGPYDEAVLASAAKKGHSEIVEILIKKGADLNKQDRRGFTALMAAAAGGHREIVKLLIENGADLNKQNIYGEAVLDKAKDFGYTEIVTILEEAIKEQNLNKN